MSEMIARVEGLEKSFGGNKALKGISFAIGRGDIYGFIGKNGAGKTTVMRILCGLMRPDKGEVNVSACRIGYLPQSIRFEDNRSATGILKFFGKIKGGGSDGAVHFAQEMGLDLTQKAKHMSPGQQRKLQLAVATAGDPQLLILDEPTAGLDPVGVQQVRDVIRALNAQGSTVFVSSHVLMELDTVCSKVAVIEQGQILYQGPCDHVYELDVDGASDLPDGRYRCEVTEGKLYAHIERGDVPGLLAYLHECGVSVYGVKRVGLETFYNKLMKEESANG